MTYSLIAEHGLIGDLPAVALVTTDGTIDWFLLPRFDSPSVIAPLLDDRRGGSLRLGARPAGPHHEADVHTGHRHPRDAVPLGVGIAEVVDFMPIDRPHMASDRRRIVRVVRGIHGEVEFDASVEPRFDYGRRSHRLRRPTRARRLVHTNDDPCGRHVDVHVPRMAPPGASRRAPSRRAAMGLAEPVAMYGEAWAADEAERRRGQAERT
jgi:GH15 family glucan-1,4-alpha-glucosidase